MSNKKIKVGKCTITNKDLFIINNYTTHFIYNNLMDGSELFFLFDRLCEENMINFVDSLEESINKNIIKNIWDGLLQNEHYYIGYEFDEMCEYPKNKHPKLKDIFDFIDENIKKIKFISRKMLENYHLHFGDENTESIFIDNKINNKVSNLLENYEKNRNHDISLEIIKKLQYSIINESLQIYKHNNTKYKNDFKKYVIMQEKLHNYFHSEITINIIKYIDWYKLANLNYL